MNHIVQSAARNSPLNLARKDSMFTGLIQAVGTLQVSDPEHVEITCPSAHSPILKDLEIGDSVAVDGVCLTINGDISERY